MLSPTFAIRKKLWMAIIILFLSVCLMLCVHPCPAAAAVQTGCSLWPQWDDHSPPLPPSLPSLFLSRPPSTCPIITNLMGAKQRPEDDKVSLLLCYFGLEQCHKQGECNNVQFGNSNSLDFWPSALVFVSKVPNYSYIVFFLLWLLQCPLVCDLSPVRKKQWDFQKTSVLKSISDSQRPLKTVSLDFTRWLFIDLPRIMEGQIKHECLLRETENRGLKKEFALE